MPQRSYDCASALAQPARNARWLGKRRRLAFRRGVIAIGFLSLFALFALPALSPASLHADETESGSGSRKYRNEAVAAIPFQQLNQRTREKVSAVVNKPSIYRRLPMTTIGADPDYFQYLVRYPEVIVNIWQLMGVTQMKTQRTGPFTLDTDDGAGTLSKLDLVFGNDNLHIFHGSGTYEGPMIRRKLAGSCVLVLQTRYTTDQFGKPQAINQLDVFVKIDNAALGLIAKSIAPLVGSTADHNFVESIKFVERLNETTENNGPGVQHMATRFQIDEDVRNGFIEVAGQVFERSAQNINARNHQRSAARPTLRQSSKANPGRSNLPNTVPYSGTPSMNLPSRNGPALNPPAMNGPAVRPPNQIAPAPSSQGNWKPLPSAEADMEANQHSILIGGPAGYRAAARPMGYHAPVYSPQQALAADR